MTTPSTDPVPLSQEARRDIAERMATCPFVGTAVATGQLPVLHDAEHPLADIESVVRLGDLGGGDLGSLVLKLFARGNHSRWVSPPELAGQRVPTGTFSLQFGGSQGAHAGHSGILLDDPREIGHGRFDPEAFNRLKAHVDRDGLLSTDSVGRFIAANLKMDRPNRPKVQVMPLRQLLGDSLKLLNELKDLLLGGNEREITEAISALTKVLGDDHLIASAGEWGLLFAFLENSPRSDNGAIALSDVEALFVTRQFPAGWETWKKTALSWVMATSRLASKAARAYYFP
ncbi:hypothetical protein QQM79_16080 [Marinobacteraceae bacterium S3BR75-40.1]